MTVRPVAAKHEPGKSYELWLVQDSLGAPKSLGVIDDPHVDDASLICGLQTRRDQRVRRSPSASNPKAVTDRCSRPAP